MGGRIWCLHTEVYVCSRQAAGAPKRAWRGSDTGCGSCVLRLQLPPHQLQPALHQLPPAHLEAGLAGVHLQAVRRLQHLPYSRRRAEVRLDGGGVLGGCAAAAGAAAGAAKAAASVAAVTLTSTVSYSTELASWHDSRPTHCRTSPPTHHFRFGMV